MKTLVCIKQVGSVADDLEFTDDGRAIDPDFLDYALNEWDACAVEAALALREAEPGEVIALTAGDDEADKVVQRALAMGADRGVRIALQTQDPLSAARALAAVAGAESPDLVLCGVQSADLGQRRRRRGPGGPARACRSWASPSRSSARARACWFP